MIYEINCLVFFLLLPVIVWPQSRTVVKYGYIDTDFRKLDSEDIFRNSFGIGREYFPKKDSDFYFSYALNYLRKASRIKYVDWSYDGGETVYFGRLEADVAFIELPIQFGYQIQVMGSRLFLAFASGLSISFPVKDHSKTIRLQEHYYGPLKRYNASYTYWDEQGLESGMNAIYSAALFYRFVGFEIQYSRALGETLGFSGITVREYFDCWHFLMRISF